MLYRLEKLIDGKWWMEGTYSEAYLTQMASAIGQLYLQGFEIYKTLRIVKVVPDGD